MSGNDRASEDCGKDKGMMNLLMREDKTIRLTNAVPIYQYDTSMDKLRILVPHFWGEQDLTEFNAVLSYMLPDGTIGTETLVLDEEPYNEDYISYTIVITTTYTSLPGTDYLKIVFAKVDQSDTAYVLRSQLGKLPILSDNVVSGEIDPGAIARIESQIADLDYRLNVEAAKILNIDENGLKIVL